jgi:catechol 2,3-dioxygenase-like lactoylglutathione lyase family enzyme
MPPPTMTTELAITFLYYRDLTAAAAFYEDIMGLALVIDQGWSKIYRLCGSAHVGLVDEARGMHRAADAKPVQLCLRVSDVDEWYAYAHRLRLPNLSHRFENHELGIRAFVFEDPEGYQIEIQQATRPGA